MSESPERLGASCLILGYDRTDSARRAAAWAARQIGPDGKLVIVHAGRPLHAPTSALSTVEERRELGRALIDELLLEETGSLQEVDVEADVSDRDPVAALIDAARRHGAQAIVVGHEQALAAAPGARHRHERSRRTCSPAPVISVPSALSGGAQGAAVDGASSAARADERAASSRSGRGPTS